MSIVEGTSGRLRWQGKPVSLPTNAPTLPHVCVLTDDCDDAHGTTIIALSSATSIDLYDLIDDPRLVFRLALVPIGGRSGQAPLIAFDGTFRRTGRCHMMVGVWGRFAFCWTVHRSGGSEALFSNAHAALELEGVCSSIVAMAWDGECRPCACFVVDGRLKFIRWEVGSHQIAFASASTVADVSCIAALDDKIVCSYSNGRIRKWRSPQVGDVPNELSMHWQTPISKRVDLAIDLALKSEVVIVAFKSGVISILHASNGTLLARLPRLGTGTIPDIRSIAGPVEVPNLLFKREIAHEHAVLFAGSKLMSIHLSEFVANRWIIIGMAAGGIEIWPFHQDLSNEDSFPELAQMLNSDLRVDTEAPVLSARVIRTSHCCDIGKEPLLSLLVLLECRGLVLFNVFPSDEVDLEAIGIKQERLIDRPEVPHIQAETDERLEEDDRVKFERHGEMESAASSFTLLRPSEPRHCADSSIQSSSSDKRLTLLSHRIKALDANLQDLRTTFALFSSELTQKLNSTMNLIRQL